MVGGTSSVNVTALVVTLILPKVKTARYWLPLSAAAAVNIRVFEVAVGFWAVLSSTHFGAPFAAVATGWAVWRCRGKLGRLSWLGWDEESPCGAPVFWPPAQPARTVVTACNESNRARPAPRAGSDTTCLACQSPFAPNARLPPS